MISFFVVECMLVIFVIGCGLMLVGELGIVKFFFFELLVIVISGDVGLIIQGGVFIIED